MIFTTIEFVIFLLAFLTPYLFIKEENRKLIIISIFNLIFYSFSNIFLCLWLINWSVLIWLGTKKGYLKYLAIIGGILQISFFKIYETRILNDIFSNILTPIGISFFTFQGLTYLFAVHKIPKEKTELHIDESWSFLKIFAFIGFFPTIFSGPILRAKAWSKQMEQPFQLEYKQLNYGLSLIALGCFYKLCLASYLHEMVSIAFSSPSEENWINLWIGMYSYSFEIFHDFAGYSLMSIGIAHLFGFNIPANFNKPYFSLSIKDFWTKWHISLSTWFRDYLYLPLGGKNNKFRNVAIVMTTSGLWHGLSGNYIAWGLLHTLGILAFHYSTGKIRINSFISWFLTIHYLFFAWIFFRSPDFNFALDYINNMFYIDFDNIDKTNFIYIGLCLFCLFVQYIEDKIISILNNNFLNNFIIISLFWSFIFILILAVSPSGTPPFIYFQY